MQLNNQNASNLLQKDKIKSNNAAKNIINNSDVEAWKCLIENSEYIFDFIKDFACEKLLNACTKDNVGNLFPFLEYHSPDWDDFVAAAFSKFQTDEINEKLLELLQSGTDEQKAYSAKYFCYAKYPQAREALFENSKSQNQSLAQNCAIALGAMDDVESYNYYIGQLSSKDDWEKIQAVQFLSLFSDKNAILPMLNAMESSDMPEHISGEIALFDDISERFDSQNERVKALCLDCFDNIISSLSEVWPLGTIIDFKILKGLKKILELSKNQSDPFCGKYSQILLKAKSMMNLFSEFDEYKFDEDKKTIQELENICSFLNSLSQDFWEAQIDNLFDELSSDNIRRKSSAINLVSYLEMKAALPYLIEIIEGEQNESVLCQAVMTVSKLGGIEQIKNKEVISNNIKNNNIKAVVENIFFG